MEEFSAFNGFSNDDIQGLCNYFQCREVPSGTILWREGEECEYAAFIVSGRIKVSKQTELKGNPVVMGIYGKGSYVGALCILDESPREVTAQALEDSSLVVIAKENFEKLLEQHPALAANLMKGMLLSLSRRLKNSFDRLVSIF
jgi:CRP-like cAMP-binding protein